LIYEPTDSTTLHAGDARYFTPPLENINSSTIQKFDNTSNASAADQIPSKPSVQIISTWA
jgi:hypothetical protein